MAGDQFYVFEQFFNVVNCKILKYLPSHLVTLKRPTGLVTLPFVFSFVSFCFALMRLRLRDHVDVCKK